MLNKTTFILLFLFSFSAQAAFNSVESGELNKINEGWLVKVKKAEQELNNDVSLVKEDMPENIKMIDDLHKSWISTIKFKCDLKSVESKGTDAETAILNECLLSEYQSASVFFRGLNG